jgi:hypothetical protein
MEKYGNDDFLGHAIFIVDVFQKLGVLLEVRVCLGYHIFLQKTFIDNFLIVGGKSCQFFYQLFELVGHGRRLKRHLSTGKESPYGGLIKTISY